MPFAFVAIGLVLVMAGIQDTHAQLGSQLRKDFVGGYMQWVLAIVLIGSLGYIDAVRPLSRAFLTLIIVGMLVANPNFFTEVQKAVREGPISPTKSAGGDQGAKTAHDATIEAVKKGGDHTTENLNALAKIGKTLGQFFLGGPAF